MSLISIGLVMKSLSFMGANMIIYDSYGKPKRVICKYKKNGLSLRDCYNCKHKAYCDVRTK